MTADRVVTGWHQLSDQDFGALAGGFGGRAAVARLRDAQLSKHLLLLRYIVQAWPGATAGRDAAIATLTEVQARDSAVYAHVFSDPLVGAWAASTTRRLRGGGEADAADLGHLGGLAAAAALRAGVDAELTAYARNGCVTLPGVADIVLPDGGDGEVPITVARGGITVGAARVRPIRGGPSWQAVRTLTGRFGELGCEVTLEEGNPYRNRYHAPAAPRMPADAALRWQETFTEAWRLICRFLPARATELATGLRSLVPLVDDGSGAARSGTARDAFGVLGLTPPRSPVDLAITLVHEFQHSKLSAVLDLRTLYRHDGTELHFAPWRTDPRPTGGLIQGVYAFLGIADSWHALRAAPGLAELAAAQFATSREMVAAGLGILEGSAELTAAGRCFTAGMRRSLARLLAEPLPPDLVRMGRDALAERRAAWQERNAASPVDGGA